MRAQSFLSPNCDVRPANNRAGQKVVAACNISKGELIAIWNGALVDRNELETLATNIRRYALQVEDNYYIVSMEGCEPADCINHSCSPNAGLSGQVGLVAMRDINAGEEITYDFAMSDGSPYDEFDCQCGAPECRGRITGQDWKLNVLRQRYFGYFSPYLERRIANQRREAALDLGVRVARRRPALEPAHPAE